MNNKYSVACITLVRDKYKINTDGMDEIFAVKCKQLSSDSIQKFDSKSNRTAHSIRDSIRTQKTIRRSLHIIVIIVCLLQTSSKNVGASND